MEFSQLQQYSLHFKELHTIKELKEGTITMLVRGNIE
jgi:hypothetical protein